MEAVGSDRYRRCMGEILPFPEREAVQPAEAPAPLWRELIGHELHRERRDRRERLVDVA